MSTRLMRMRDMHLAQRGGVESTWRGAERMTGAGSQPHRDAERRGPAQGQVAAEVARLPGVHRFLLFWGPSHSAATSLTHSRHSLTYDRVGTPDQRRGSSGGKHQPAFIC
jgi:hypothetical protein